jgi:hypothetical protein
MTTHKEKHQRVILRQRAETIRTPGTGEELVMQQDLFVRQAFTGGVLTPVEGEDLEDYLAPYPTPESRRPILAWAQQNSVGWRTPRTGGAYRGLRRVAGEQFGHSEAAHDLRGITHPFDRPGTHCVVQNQHRRLGDRRLRSSWAPRPGGPPRRDRRRDQRMGRPPPTALGQLQEIRRKTSAIPGQQGVAMARPVCVGTNRRTAISVSGLSFMGSASAPHALGHFVALDCPPEALSPGSRPGPAFSTAWRTVTTTARRSSKGRPGSRVAGFDPKSSGPNKMNLRRR